MGGDKGTIMIQFFIFGDSVAYGVGAEQGWSDLLKQHLHAAMYERDGIGEKYELYNFGKPGAGVDFVLKTHESLLEAYGRHDTTVAILCIGGNETKARTEPDNFVSSTDAFASRMTTLIDSFKQQVDNVIVLPTLIAVDETKVNPKVSPFNGGKSFFVNDRIYAFNETLKNLCSDRGISYVVPGINPNDWAANYLYEDGLHPNQSGNEQIFHALLPFVERFLLS